MKRCIITILFVLVFALQCACTSRKNDSMSDSVGSTESVSLSAKIAAILVRSIYISPFLYLKVV